MPRLSTEGSAVTGIAGGIIGIDGATPAALVGFVGGYWSWLSTSVVVGPGENGDGWKMYQYSTATELLTEVDTFYASFAAAGGGVYAMFNPSSLIGTETNVPGFGPFTASKVLDVSEAGLVALLRGYQTGAGLDVYSAAGALLFSANVILTSHFVAVRNGVVAYQDAGGWHLVTVATGVPIAGFVSRQSVHQVIPFVVGSTLSVAEYDHATDIWTIRAAAGSGGFVIDTEGLAYNSDFIGISSTTVRMAWGTTQGENPDHLVLLDINVSNGTTVRWTVVDGVLESSVGPTLEGTSFAMIDAAKFYPPVQHAVMDRSGRMSEPWQAWARLMGLSVAGVQTSINAATAARPAGGPGESGFLIPSPTAEDLDGTPSAGISPTYSRGDHKHDDPNRPNDDEKAALNGTDGTPSALNPYVTDSDPRNSDARDPTLHATSHEDSGLDELDVTALGGFPGGTTDFLRADGSFAVPPGGGGPHAVDHEEGGTDEVDVTLLGGFPGGTTDFLRADGSFAPPPGGSPSYFMSPVTTGGDPSTAELIFGPDGDVVMVPEYF